jgi:hypothetical protein
MTENNNGQKRPELLRFPRITDNRGSLTFLQHPLNAPFNIRRVFYLYGMPEGSQRGGHAHVYEEQLLIAISGSFNVKIFDGTEWQTFTLDSPDVGLYVPPPFWRELHDFTPGAACLTLSSTDFDPSDYLSPIDEYLSYLRANPAPAK